MKSIFETLDDLQTETSVPKITDKKSGEILRENFGLVPHSIPRELFPTAEQFKDSEKLLAWADENNFTYHLLQKAIQKLLIEVRGAFKSIKKDTEWTVEAGQEKVNTYQITEVVQSKERKSAEENAKDYLNDMSPEQLKNFIASMKKK